MTREEAREFLIFISRALGNMSIEYLTEKDGEEMREAIKALEQEPKTIQEKQAESEKYQIAYDNGYDNGYAQARFDYEQESKTGHWIPVSERLPEYGEEVITVNSDDDYEINLIIDDDLNEWFYDGVVAWMPLPTPYETQKSEVSE